jgi:outer membrane scaffolding protein for murein synthesis (MipA/OmpV family)
MKPYVKHFLIGFLSTTALLIASNANAQNNRDKNEVSGTVFAGVATLPEYEGASEQQVIPLAAGEVRWGERYVSLEGTTLRANVINSSVVEFGPVANLTFGRDEDIESAPVRALGVIDEAYEVGAFGAVKFGSLLSDGDGLKLRLQGLRDVSDVHDGWIGQAALSYRLPVSNRLSVTTEASVQFVDDNYAQTYFSVTPAGSIASGLTAFNAEGGIKDIGASVTAVYAVSDRLSLLGFAGYRRMLGDFKDSPIIAVEGDANQFSAGIGLGLSF